MQPPEASSPTLLGILPSRHVHSHSKTTFLKRHIQAPLSTILAANSDTPNPLVTPLSSRPHQPHHPAPAADQCPKFPQHRPCNVRDDWPRVRLAVFRGRSVA